MSDKEKGLPDEVLRALDDGSMDLRHNWMYSFMPMTFYTYWDGFDRPTADKIYLVAYCKVCDQTVSAIVPTEEYSVRIARAYIPKMGCRPVDQ